MQSLATATVRKERREDADIVYLSGPATVAEAGALHLALSHIQPQSGRPIILDLGDVTKFDTVGAWLIYRFMRDWRFLGAPARYDRANDDQERLIEQALINDAPCAVRPQESNLLLRQLEDLGAGTVRVIERFGSLLDFLGLVILRMARLLMQPKRIRWVSLSYHLEHVGFKALPIIGLMSFLIGLVLVQQGAFQLKRFGAEIFVVDLVSISTLRELGVILTAIMVAGRSGSAFTAQIGSMRLNEEVDAMLTIGLDPIDTLVMPRLIALIIVMPLLVFYAGMMSLFGGMLFGWLSLDIPITTFITRMHATVTIDDFIVGMIKAPVFGLIIAVAGCYEGMQVAGDAASVGNRTTQSVVESIFLVIVIDAFFAVFFTTIGL